ncbi:MAG: transcriptional regulator GcvA [Pseudomonadota bacterium]
MSRSLPPLTALRAFEAAARRQGFNLAAEELSVTPSAVSHQVRALEDWLGKTLFERRARRVELTADGQDLLPDVTHALDLLAESCARVASRSNTPTLTVSVAHTFANGWLVSRLPAFQLALPNIEVRLLLASSQLESHFANPDVDVAIAHGRAQAGPGISAVRLMSEELIPVCSPSLVDAHGPLHGLADLGKVTLLQVLPRMGQWRAWLDLAGIHDVDPDRGPRFQSTPLALEAAMAGAGLALANRRFVAPHLASRRLVSPFEIDLPGDTAYFLLYRDASPEGGPVQQFKRWLLEAIETDPGSAT